MQIKRALIKNSIAGIWSKGSSLLFRIIQVPLLFSVLGVDDFGRWLLISSLPAWLGLANLGFGSVAANEMIMLTATNKEDEAESVFSTTLTLVLLIGLIGTILLFLIVPFIPWESLLDAGQEKHTEYSFAIIWMAISVFLSFSGEAFGARFKAARKAHLSVIFASFSPWLDILFMFISLQFSKRLDFLALAILFSNIVYLLSIMYFSRNAMPSIKFSFMKARISYFKLLFRKGLAFQAFPLGNALLYQGNLMIIKTVIGLPAVALFGTARTLVRSINQVFELINQAIWPEMSLLLAGGKLTQAARLHRLGVFFSVSAAIISVVILAIFGQALYTLWVGKAIMLPQHLLLLFLFPIPFNALWYTSSVIHVACNQHENLAARYLLATVLSFSLCILLSYYFGIEGAAVSTFLVDLILIPFVIKRSLKITSDTWYGFFLGIKQEIYLAVKILVEYFKKSKKEKLI